MHRRSLIIVVIATLVAHGFTADAASEDATDAALGFVRCDPANVLGADSCVKCHANEFEVWKATPHHATFETLHRKPEAKEIAERLGLRSVKRNETCAKCHYTSALQDGKRRVVAGVSCESCHGGAKDWLDMHSDYGGPNATRESESPQHRRQRIEASLAAGMNNPANLYLIARQCLACHTSPDEKLVNVGGHAAGSGDFELVAWSQGMVRHNFLAGDGKANAPASAERLRVMYVVGVMADLEASFRATAAATKKAAYGVTAARRALAMKKRLYQIQQITDNPYVRQATDAALATELKLGNREALVAAADVIGKAAREFAAAADGATLEAVDQFLPSPASYK